MKISRKNTTTNIRIKRSTQMRKALKLSPLTESNMVPNNLPTVETAMNVQIFIHMAQTYYVTECSFRKPRNQKKYEPD